MSYLVSQETASTRARPDDLPVQVTQASRLFEQFHCFPPAVMVRRRCPRQLPPVLVPLGELRGVIYRSDRGQCGRPRTFVHFFKSPPLLACDPAGQCLHIVGGRYQITPRGIEG